MKPKSTSGKKPDTPEPGTIDLREELQDELQIQFLKNLKTDGSLSANVCDALTKLLTSNTLTSADILGTLQEEDDIEGEATDE